MMKVKEVAALSGISVRTLHHYDEIGLLKPDHVTEVGYRQYSDENLAQLQQILFFRELGFTLKSIKEMMENPNINRREALEMQRKLLLKKRKQLDEVIETIDKTIRTEKGEYMMTNREKFNGFDFSRNLYEEEARERWGDDVINTSKKKMAQFGPLFQEEMNAIYLKLSMIRHLSPTSDEAQIAIGEWFTLLNKIGTYSVEAFRGLGEMYITDERFTKNIDQFGEGLAQFMRDAMIAYAK